MAGFLAAAACAPPAAPPTQPVAHPCLVLASEPGVRDTITVALPSADVPAFLRLHLDSVPQVLDCEFQPLPAPAGRFFLGGDSLLIPADTSLPAVRVMAMSPAADPRDPIDRGVDVVVTTQASAIDYARNRRDLRLVPLAWSAVYAVGYPAGPPPVELTPRLREDLARDAVGGGAMPADSLEWWAQDPSCRVQSNTPVVRLPGIGIPGDDPIARAVAERLVALARPSGARRVIPFSSRQFDSLAARGSAAAFVFPLPRQRPLDCAEAAPLPAGWSLEPLILIRATALLRPGVPSFFITADGIRFISPP